MVSGESKSANAPHQLQGAAWSGNPTLRRRVVPARPPVDGRALTAACGCWTAARDPYLNQAPAIKARTIALGSSRGRRSSQLSGPGAGRVAERLRRCRMRTAAP